MDLLRVDGRRKSLKRLTETGSMSVAEVQADVRTVRSEVQIKSMA